MPAYEVHRRANTPRAHLAKRPRGQREIAFAASHDEAVALAQSRERSAEVQVVRLPSFGLVENEFVKAR
jgi:hypothetical protein